ncbi:MAG TPA: TfoX/Sxy family protein [Thermohalobaculum sp.]|nr:TfoX/Sxy family protein [Thermohalobaculum sp.]
MGVSPEFSEHIHDLFDRLGPVRTRRMFGGAGVFLGEAMFALVVDDTLYMKADAELARAYAAAGSEPFSYAARDGTRTLAAFMRLPDAALDDADEALAWARRSLVPAEAAAAAKAAARARKAGRDAAR